MKSITIKTREGNITVEPKRFKTVYTFKAGTAEEFRNEDLEQVLKYVWPRARGENLRNMDKARLDILTTERSAYRMHWDALAHADLSDLINKVEDAGVMVMDIEVPCQGDCGETCATTFNEFTPIHDAAYAAFDDGLGCGEHFLCEECDRASKQLGYDEARAEDAAEAKLEMAMEHEIFNVA